MRVAGARCAPSGYVRSVYTEAEVDLFAIYCGDLDRAFLVPVILCAGKKELWLRLSSPRNNQRSCINLAEDYHIYGAIDKLGERSAGSRKVGGSSPPSSTPEPADSAWVGANEFRDRFGYWIERAGAGGKLVITRRGRPLARLVLACGEHAEGGG